MPAAPPDAAALRAATLSFASSNPASPAPSRTQSSTQPSTVTASRNTHSRSSSTASAPHVDQLLLSPTGFSRRPEPSRDPQWVSSHSGSTSTERSRSGSPSKSSASSSRTSQQSASSVAANLAFARSPATSPRPPMSEDALPAGGTVLSRRKLFQDAGAGEERPRSNTSSAPPPVHRISPERSRPGSPTAASGEGVDSASVEDIAALRNMFERGRKPAASPAVHAPKPIPVHKQQSASVMAAVLATQLSPPGSAATSRRGSPERSAPESPAHSTTSQAPRKLVPPPPSRKKPSLSGTAISPKLQEPFSPIVTARSTPNDKPVGALDTPPKPPPPRKTRASEPTSATNASFASSAPPAQDSDTPGHTPTKPPTPPPPRSSAARPSSSIPPSTASPLSNPNPSIAKKLLPEPTVSSDSSKPPPPPPRSTPSTPISTPTPPTSSTAPPPPAPRRSAASDNLSTKALPTASQTSSSLNTTNTGTPSPSVSNSATIAASLAPSRTQTPGPRKPPAPDPPPSRKQTRTSQSPNKHLRATLRDPGKSRKSSTSPPPVRNRLTLHGHHAEAKNPLYYAKISDRQRKRYEGLWAANRGLLGVDRDAVHGFVVRDIWSRSRLGNRVLAEIWDAVDRGEKGWLEREEMVVGTWLVDQSLRGKKVPVKVQESVWDSVRRIHRM